MSVALPDRERVDAFVRNQMRITATSGRYQLVATANAIPALWEVSALDPDTPPGGFTLVAADGHRRCWWLWGRLARQHMGGDVHKLDEADLPAFSSLHRFRPKRPPLPEHQPFTRIGRFPGSSGDC